MTRYVLEGNPAEDHVWAEVRRDSVTFGITMPVYTQVDTKWVERAPITLPRSVLQAFLMQIQEGT